MTIEKEMLITDVLSIDSGLFSVLQGYGLHCLGCPSARSESLEMAAAGHGIDIDKLITDLNGYLKNKE